MRILLVSVVALMLVTNIFGNKEIRAKESLANKFCKLKRTELGK